MYLQFIVFTQSDAQKKTLNFNIEWFAEGRWFSPGIPVSSINKSDRHEITDILFKVALNTITITLNIGLHWRIILKLSENLQINEMHFGTFKTHVYLIRKFILFCAILFKVRRELWDSRRSVYSKKYFILSLSGLLWEKRYTTSKCC